MMSEADLQKAKAAFAIQDVYLCEATVWADRRIDPGAQIPSVNAQFKISPTNDAEILHLEPTATEPSQSSIRFLVRYFVGTGLRLLYAHADPAKSNITRDDLMADIEAT